MFKEYSTTPKGTAYWNFTMEGYDIQTVDITGDDVENLTGVSPTNVPIKVTGDIQPGHVVKVGVVGHAVTGHMTIPTKYYPLLITNFKYNRIDVLSPHPVVLEVVKNQLVTWSAPNVLPADYQKLEQVVQLSGSRTFNNPTHLSHFRFEVTNGIEPTKVIPTEVGQDGLDKVLPETIEGTFWFRSKYIATIDGVEYSDSSWSDARCFVIPSDSHSLSLDELRYKQFSKDGKVLEAAGGIRSGHNSYHDLYEGKLFIPTTCSQWYGLSKFGCLTRTSSHAEWDDMYPDSNTDPDSVIQYGDRNALVNQGQHMLFCDAVGKKSAVDVSENGVSNPRMLDTSDASPWNVSGDGVECTDQRIYKIGPNVNEILTWYWDDSDAVGVVKWKARVEKVDLDATKLETTGNELWNVNLIYNSPHLLEVDPVKGYVVAVCERRDHKTNPAVDITSSWIDTREMLIWKRKEDGHFTPPIILRNQPEMYSPTEFIVKDGMLVIIDEASELRYYDLDKWTFEMDISLTPKAEGNYSALPPEKVIQLSRQPLVYVNDYDALDCEPTTGSGLTFDTTNGKWAVYTHPNLINKYTIIYLDFDIRTVLVDKSITVDALLDDSIYRNLYLHTFEGNKCNYTLAESNWDGINVTPSKGIGDTIQLAMTSFS